MSHKLLTLLYFPRASWASIQCSGGKTRSRITPSGDTWIREPGSFTPSPIRTHRMRPNHPPKQPSPVPLFEFHCYGQFRNRQHRPYWMRRSRQSFSTPARPTESWKLPEQQSREEPERP